MVSAGIAWSDVGVTRFQLPTKSAVAAERLLLRRTPGAEPAAPTPEVAETIAAAKLYFDGEEMDFSAVKLDLDGQDEFFQQIYAAARRVGWGRTTTYGALAKEVGAGPEAARDVGQAMAKNPVALIIPCHRVLAAGGRVGGFSAPGGARPSSACSSSKASMSRRCNRLSGLLRSKPGGPGKRWIAAAIDADYGKAKLA